ncbi:hypothetical protein FALCPG4_007470 [Fusarium falciforme]
MGASEYEQPDRFWPERFLNEDLDKPIKGHLAFEQAAEYAQDGSSPATPFNC